MADRKKKINKKRYLSDFTKDENGKYEYSGKVYFCNSAADERKKRYISLGALSVLSAALLVYSGCVDGAGTSSCLYIVIPYVISIFFAGMLVYTTFRLISKKNEVREYVYKATALRMPYYSLFLAVSCLVSEFSVTLYTFLNGFGDKAAQTFMYMIFHLLCAISALLYRNIVLSIEWTAKK